METSTVLVCLACVAAFCAAACFASAAFDVRGRKARVRKANVMTHTGLLRHGVPALKPFAETMLRISQVRSVVEKAVEAFRERGVVTTCEALLSLATVVLLIVVALCWLATKTLLSGIAVSACVIALAVMQLNSLDDRRTDAIRNAVPDAFRSMESCFQAGLSLLQTLRQVAKESSGPLKNVLLRASHQLEMGGTTARALAELKSVQSVPELAFAAVALDVQHQTGGSLRQVLESARESVEGQLALRRSLRVQTAQAKLSARIVSIMPFILLALFSLVSEGFLDPFFESVQGVCLLGLAFLMQAAGILTVRKMLAVEVD